VTTRRRRTRLAAAGILVALAAVAGFAQSRSGVQILRPGFGFNEPVRPPTARTFRGGFNFCRLMFGSNRREKGGWRTDYPGADYNLSVRLGELTKTRVTTDDAGRPEYAVVRPTDAALFQCPMIFAEDAGTVEFTEEEVTSLRKYFQKGGFLFVSDYWGARSEEQWEAEISRVLPSGMGYTISEIPMTHPVWHSMFDLTEIPQMASLQTWSRTGGIVERWAESDAVVEVRGIADSHGRLMVLAIHNSDIPDPWEREGEDQTYFNLFSPNAYRVALDVVMYAMTR
jgi:hypothetical protein